MSSYRKDLAWKHNSQDDVGGINKSYVYLKCGFLFVGGLFGFLFSRSSASLTTSMLGATILVLAVFSLKVWRKGFSSLPFIFGQLALAATLLVKHFWSYSLTKKLFPSGLYIFMSLAMFYFYSYVALSGGNPPPKKKLVASS